MAGADTIERLKAYLRELSPQARELLIGEFERSLLRGDDLAGTELVLEELRRLAREQSSKRRRASIPAPACFSNRSSRSWSTARGNIAILAGSRVPRLRCLWNWIRRDILPDDAKLVDEKVAAALVTGDEDKAEYFIRVFQDRVAAALTESLRVAATDSKMRRRMLAQIGTPHPGEDAAALKVVLKARDGLDTLASRLPVKVPNLASGQLDECKALIEKTCDRDEDLYPYTLLTVMNRLAAPWQLIRLGVRAAGSDTAARVAETPFGMSVTIVLAELERQVDELREDLRKGRGDTVGALLKTIHDSARGLRTELDLPVNSTWGRSLSALRGQIADMLRLEIESMPGRVRRLLRPRPAGDISPGSMIDPKEVAETEALVAFVGNCRNFASEFAINEMTQRTCAELQQYLDSGTQGLLEALRQSGPVGARFPAIAAQCRRAAVQHGIRPRLRRAIGQGWRGGGRCTAQSPV